MSATQNEGPTRHAIDVRERTRAMGDRPGEALDKRLFMQLLVYDCARELPPKDAIKLIGEGLVQKGAQGVVYEDVNNPRGIAVLTFSDDPSAFVGGVRQVLSSERLCGLMLRPEFTMLGRTYATGFEPDLKHWLLDRPRETALNAAWPWAIWYPLRRSGAFERVPPEERHAILKEHGEIGKAYGAADLAHDIRLVCHGLDARDNEFVVGLIGKELHPLSHVVQAMRPTRQTSEFIVQMGPFFVGRAIYRTPV